MPETPNHGYNVPNEGEQNWHEPLNENFEQYDTDIEIRDQDANRGNYDPKQGAKFLATDTGVVYFGDGSSWQSAFDLAASGVESIGGVGPDDQGNVDLESSDGSVEFDFDAAGNLIDLGLVERQTFSRLDPVDDFLGVGLSDPITGNDVFSVRADVNADVFGGMYVETTNQDGWPFYGYAAGGDAGAWHYYYPEENKWALDFDVGQYEALVVDNDGNLSVKGDINAEGNKNFVQTVDTDDGEREVVYTATEAGTAHTEASGVAELEGGRAEVDLPDHFGWVTDDDEPLMVQVTPHASEPVRPQVTERSPDRIVVEDFGDGTGSYEVSYTVKGTREGHADKEVVREPTSERTESPSPAPADD